MTARKDGKKLLKGVVMKKRAAPVAPVEEPLEYDDGNEDEPPPKRRRD
jgi:hypothetical protein